MRKQQFLTLTSVNLRYANPQLTDKARKKGKAGSTLTSYLLFQYALSGVVFLLVYGLTMITLDFSQMPGFFTAYVALFGILGFSQGISSIYNVFFESQDLPAYLPLPFRQSEIFLAKIVVVFLTVAPFIFPLLVLFLLTGIRANVFFLLTILWAFLLFGLFLVLIFSICSLIVFSLTRTKFFLKHKKLVTSLLLGVTMLVVVIGVLMMNQVNTYETDVVDRGAISFLLPFYYVMVAPFQTTGLLSLLGIIATAGVLLFALYRLILPKFYEQVAAAAPNQGSVRRKHKPNQGLGQLLFNYNSQLIRDPNLIMQVFSSSLLMPIIFLVSFVFTGAIQLSELDERFIGVVFVAGIALAALMVNPTSFISNLISLDQENFLFVRSLPLSMKRYLREKFRFGVVLQLSLTAVIVLAAVLLFKMPLILAVSFLIGALWSSFLLCLKYFARDYRLLLLDWTNISQLFTRGAGSLGLAIGTIATLFLSIIVIILYGFAATSVNFWLLNGPVFFVILLTSVLWIAHYHHRFWRRFS
ncbi:MAG: ABC transporter [Enterococcus casseliflavus]|uniref:ABC transporter n=1 Tax=Enterococcus TaxID=1350 RepID=UPI0022E3832C|nr:ABC transporter [Enterococcus casseliflavus]MDO7872211.1 ABC transporter [Enterococcus casseliflavus]MEB6085240.1 ABC transporter [Enterococcus casseliflavus]